MRASERHSKIVLGGALALTLFAPRDVAASWDHVYTPTTLPEDYAPGPWVRDEVFNTTDSVSLEAGRLCLNLDDDSDVSWFRDSSTDPALASSELTVEWSQEATAAGAWDLFAGDVALSFLEDHDATGTPVSQAFMFQDVALDVDLGTGRHIYRIVRRASAAELWVDGALKATAGRGFGSPDFVKFHMWGSRKSPAPYRGCTSYIAYAAGAFTPQEHMVTINRIEDIIFPINSHESLPPALFKSILEIGSGPLRFVTTWEPRERACPQCIASISWFILEPDHSALATWDWSGPACSSPSGGIIEWSGGCVRGVPSDAQPIIYRNPTPAPGAYLLSVGLAISGLRTTLTGRIEVFSNEVHVGTLGPFTAIFRGGFQHFLVRVKEAPARHLRSISGDGQTGTIGKTLPLPLVIKVQDAQGNPKSGVTVTFAPKSSPAGQAGFSVAPVQPTTDAQGLISANVMLGNRAGTYEVAAACAECEPNTLTFTAQGKLFLQVSLSTPSIKPVPFGQVVTAENQAAITVRAFGVNGPTDTVANYPVVLISSTVPNSGGHDHDGTRPFGGAFSGAGLAVANNTASGLTNAQGELFAVFTSTFFGGIEVFTASSTIDAGVAPATATLTIKAGDFQLLPDATFYIKDGGTCLHHGPDGPGGCTAPDQNHFGTAVTASAIAAIAAEWLAFAGATRMLEINDISLQLGGGFDVGGTWTADIVDQFPADKKRCNSTGHCEHRDGRQADIQVFPNTSPKALSEVMQDELRKIIINRGGRRPHEEGGHWHVRF